QIDRLEDVEVEGVFDLAARVARRELDVHDRGVLRIVGVELAVRLAGQLFVLADVLEDVAAEGRRLLLDDLDFRDVRVGCGRSDEQNGCDKGGFHAHGKAQFTPIYLGNNRSVRI